MNKNLIAGLLLALLAIFNVSHAVDDPVVVNIKPNAPKGADDIYKKNEPPVKSSTRVVDAKSNEKEMVVVPKSDVPSSEIKNGTGSAQVKKAKPNSSIVWANSDQAELSADVGLPAGKKL